jgi:hypothetical protein
MDKVSFGSIFFRWRHLSAQGRDYGRFTYMNKLHAFTEERKRAILAEV